jgi:hypothetical protein
VCEAGFVLDGLAAYEQVARNLLYDFIAQSLAANPLLVALDDRSPPEGAARKLLYDRIAHSIASDPGLSGE